MGQSLQGASFMMGFLVGIIMSATPGSALSRLEGVALGLVLGTGFLLLYTYSPLPNTTGFGVGGGGGTRWGFRSKDEGDEVTE